MIILTGVSGGIGLPLAKQVSKIISKDQTLVRLAKQLKKIKTKTKR